ncbi:cAMP-specific 3',5'-cyclic phosphodiesterase 4D [Terramyces sp. JEL0728]|nr:cAMP-specific 3',5'-cyclic phosphodiesterase 4D [Terramyces sp. JEL0728]
MSEPFYGLVIAPFFITVLFCFCYFFRLRFIYCVGLVSISLPIWYVVATLSLEQELSADGTNQLHTQSLFVWSAVSVTIALVLLCSIAYTIEWNNRIQFISNQNFVMMNTKLQRQLRGLESTFHSRMADLDSPLEKAILGVKLLLASPHITGTQIRTLHMILQCLNSSNLMAPDLYQQVKNGEVLMDKEQQNWLFNELARGQKRSRPFDEITSTDDGSDDLLKPMVLPNSLISPETSIIEEDETSGSIPRGHPERADGIPPKPSSSSLSSLSIHQIKLSKPLPDISSLLTLEVLEYLERIPEYSFPIFEFADATNQNPLFVMSHKLVIQSGLLSKLQFSPVKFMNFMADVEKGYDPNLSYHNSIHATDVLHGIHHLAQLDNIHGIFSDIEMLSIYIAAAIHDFGHPGVNNNFLISTNHKFAMLYNDKSVLENHHCSAGLKLLMKPDNYFFENIDKKTFTTIRSSIISMVLATDLALHFDLLTAFKKKVATAGTFDPYGNGDDRVILMQIIMKCADVANPTKESSIYDQWIQRITEEFYNQGDKEKQLGLPISPFSNREAQNLNSSQKSFIEFIVYPLFESLEMWTSIPEIKINLDCSRDKYCKDIPPPSPKEEAADSKRPGRKSLRPLRLDFARGQTEGNLRSAQELYSPQYRRASVAHNRRPSVVAGFIHNLSEAKTNMTIFQTTRSNSTTALASPLTPSRQKPIIEYTFPPKNNEIEKKDKQEEDKP